MQGFGLVRTRSTPAQTARANVSIGTIRVGTRRCIPRADSVPACGPCVEPQIEDRQHHRATRSQLGDVSHRRRRSRFAPGKEEMPEAQHSMIPTMIPAVIRSCAPMPAK